MKSLLQINAFYIYIFITDIFVTVISINNTLNKQSYKESVEIAKDSLYRF
jgi:hypothetical protein